MRPRLLGISILFAGLFASASPVEFTILHTNDLHSHAEPTVIRGKSFGGYARQATLIEQFRKSDRNVMLLNGGDTFQGTLYFNVYEGLSDLVFMNEVGYQAMAVGNHEFDKGPKTFAEFVKRASFPVLAANLDVSADPDLRGRIPAYAVLRIGRERVGIVGAVTPDLPDISSIGPHVKMLDLTASVRAAAQALLREGVNRIILVSHCGYSVERKLAEDVEELDVIVGGHSHSFLCAAGIAPPEGFPQPMGLYPTVVNRPNKPRCLVLQAWEWGKVLGRIKVSFDRRGDVEGWRDGKPIFIDESIPEDPKIATMMAMLRKPIEAVMSQKIGVVETPLDRGGAMGEFIADAMLQATKLNGSVAAFINAGGVRAGAEPGELTMGKANEIQPFRNSLVVLELTGQELKEAMESTVSGDRPTGGQLIPSQGTTYEIQMSAAPGDRIRNLVVAGLPIDLGKRYRFTFLSFTANGGDAHLVLKNAQGYRFDTGLLDIDALVDYVKATTPIRRSPAGRVRTIGGTYPAAASPLLRN